MLQKKTRMFIWISLCSVLLSACGNLIEMKTDESYVQDTAVYGNSYTNIRNDGAAYINENGRVVYYSKSDIEAIVGNVLEEDAQTTQVEDVEVYYINVVGDTMYAYMRIVRRGFFVENEGYYGGGIVAYDLTTPQEEIDWYSTEVIREGVILDLQVVDGICYFTDASTKTFCKFDPTTGEETTLIDTPYKEAMVYQNRVFYTGETRGLYSISLSGNEQKKLSSSHCQKLMPYKDKILFLSNSVVAKYLKAIELDGENETFLIKWNADEITIYEDRIYYIDNEDKTDIRYMDLTDEELEEKSLGLTQEIQDELYAFAGEQIYNRVCNYTGFDNDPISAAECKHISAMNGYLLFDSGYVIANESHRLMYAYCIETGELIILNQQLEIPMEWENILW